MTNKFNKFDRVLVTQGISEGEILTVINFAVFPGLVMYKLGRGDRWILRNEKVLKAVKFTGTIHGTKLAAIAAVDTISEHIDMVGMLANKTPAEMSFKNLIGALKVGALAPLEDPLE